MTTDLIHVSVADHVATVALNRRDSLNAVSNTMLDGLIEVFHAIDDDQDVWCVVLKGNGRAFSVGADMKERRTMTPDAVRRRRRIGMRAFSSPRTCIRPVVAQVHGHALGSGLELALACDIVIAAETTTMGLIETRVGAIPGGGGTQVLPRLVGLAKAKELIFTGRKFTAVEAAGWGLISQAVPDDELEAAIGELVGEIVKSSPVANVQAKKAVNMSADLDLRSGIEAEAALYERIVTSKDRAEALAAFADNRPPRFTNE